jgi:alkanesulfonate monooxygenase SsuD/methylene tetrahydromethanopterin reductase-like flavin-dependent oxidoreductase (luciferase family)
MIGEPGGAPGWRRGRAGDAVAVSGTPGQIVDARQQAIDETGARRLLVEMFSREEARLFAAEVVPVLKQRNVG